MINDNVDEYYTNYENLLKDNIGSSVRDLEKSLEKKIKDEIEKASKFYITGNVKLVPKINIVEYNKKNLHSNYREYPATDTINNKFDYDEYTVEFFHISMTSTHSSSPSYRIYITNKSGVYYHDSIYSRSENLSKHNILYTEAMSFIVSTIPRHSITDTIQEYGNRIGKILNYFKENPQNFQSISAPIVKEYQQKLKVLNTKISSFEHDKSTYSNGKLDSIKTETKEQLLKCEEHKVLQDILEKKYKSLNSSIEILKIQQDTISKETERLTKKSNNLKEEIKNDEKFKEVKLDEIEKVKKKNTNEVLQKVEAFKRYKDKEETKIILEKNKIEADEEILKKEQEEFKKKEAKFKIKMELFEAEKELFEDHKITILQSSRLLKEEKRERIRKMDIGTDDPPNYDDKK